MFAKILLMRTFVEKPLFYLKLTLFLVVFGSLTVVRLHNYDRTPFFGHMEEHLYGWAGLHLIKGHVPISWSTLNYPQEYRIFSGFITYPSNDARLPADLIKPWLDEPPLFSLLVGASANFFDSDPWKIIPSAYLRLPVVLISIITLGLVFSLATKLYGLKVGLLALIFYGVTPSFVFGSRLAVPENVIALLLVLTVIFLWQTEKKENLLLVLILGVLPSLAGLMKPTGFFLAPLIGFWLFHRRRYLELSWLLLATISGVILYFSYGAFFGHNLFWQIVKEQGSRPTGWLGLTHLFSTPGYDITNYLDGWQVWSLVWALILSVTKLSDPKMKILGFTFWYWLAVILCSGGQTDVLLWYRYPIFPLLAIFGALGFKQCLKNPNFVYLLLAGGLLLAGRNLVANEFHATTTPWKFRVLLLLITLPGLLLWLDKKQIWKVLSQTVLAVVLTVGIYFNLVLIQNSFEINCESRACPIGPTTKFSEVHLPFIWRFFLPPK